MFPFLIYSQQQNVLKYICDRDIFYEVAGQWLETLLKNWTPPRLLFTSFASLNHLSGLVVHATMFLTEFKWQKTNSSSKEKPSCFM